MNIEAKSGAVTRAGWAVAALGCAEAAVRADDRMKELGLARRVLDLEIRSWEYIVKAI